MNDLRFAVRMMLRNRMSTALIVGLLGFGIGGATIIFSLFDQVLMRSLPARQPEQLVRMVQRLSPKFPARSNFPLAYYDALRGHASAFEYVFGETGEDNHYRMTEPAPTEEVTLRAVTPEYFNALGVNAYLGRALVLADADQKSGTPPAVLSYPFWQRRFGGDRGVIDRTITINGHRLQIVGVMAKDFNGTTVDTTPDIRIPLLAYPILTGSKVESAYLELAGRLKPGVSIPTAEAQCLAVWNASMRDFYLNSEKQPAGLVAAILARGMNLESLKRGTSVLRDSMSGALNLLMAGVTVLLLIISLNAAGLLLARTVARRPELAVRLAIGASPVRLARQIVLEGLLLSFCAGLVACCVTFALTPVAFRLLPPVRNLYTEVVPLSVDFGMNVRSFLFLLAASAICFVVFTLSPVMAVMRLTIDSILRTVRASANLRGRQLLIAMQIALCTFLLIFAGELARSFERLANTNSGFARDSVATFTCDLGQYKSYPPILKALMERVRQIPGVVSVATSSIGVMRGHGQFANIALAGQRVEHADVMNTNANNVSPDYFETMGMRLLDGRDFTESDIPKPKQAFAKKAVVNESFVKHFFPDGHALGKRFGSAAEGTLAKADYEIIGVVSDAKYRSMKDPIRPMFFTPENGVDSLVLNVRTRLKPESVIQPVRQAAASVAPDLPFLEVNTLAREVAENTAPERTMAVLSSLFSLLAAVLAGIGIYGLLQYSVRQRRREVGIRMALGARPENVARLFAAQTIWMTVSGGIVGVAAALMAGPAVQSLLYGLSPNDPVSFATAVIFLGVVAAVATVGPVWLAVQIEPSESLRLEN